LWLCLAYELCKLDIAVAVGVKSIKDYLSVFWAEISRYERILQFWRWERIWAVSIILLENTNKFLNAEIFPHESDCEARCRCQLIVTIALRSRLYGLHIGYLKIELGLALLNSCFSMDWRNDSDTVVTNVH